MVFRKFKPLKQWGKMDTRIYKEILAARNKRKMPSFVISPAVQEHGIEIHDPNASGFFTSASQELPTIKHPAHTIPQIHEHPLFKSMKCLLFDGTEAFTDGIDQACSLSKAVKKIGFPEAVLNLASKILLPERFEDCVCDCIMHGERYDPTLEKLPRYFDPIIFWTNYFPNRVYGIPTLTKGNIILDNLFRTVHLMAVGHSQLLDLRAMIEIRNAENETIPFVLRSVPHIIVQSPEPIKPWAKPMSLNNMQVPDTAPINPRIDLTSDHIYNDKAVLPRAEENLFIDTVLWCHEQNQKYPWTLEQLSAKAIVTCFGAAVTQATRHGLPVTEDIKNQPIVTRGVQLVNGRLDLVVFQLNSLDISNDSDSCKNIAWIESGLQLYKPGKFTENMDKVEDLNMDTFRKFMALLLIGLVRNILDFSNLRYYMSLVFFLSQHLKFLRRNLTTLPSTYRGFDSNRVTILYFTLSALDVLGKLDEEVDAEQREQLIDWIYRLQLTSNSGKILKNLFTWIKAMGFCMPTTPNYGFMDLGCSIYGGINMNPKVDDKGLNSTSDNYYITQHNLAHHWRRQFMIPHSVGFPQLITHTTPWTSGSTALRHKGHWSYNIPSDHLKNRNLLTTVDDTTDGTMRLWSVSEFSDRKQLLQFRLRCKQKKGLDEWSLTTIDVEDQDLLDHEASVMEQITSQVTCEGSKNILREQQIFQSNLSAKFCRVLNVDSSLLELRSWTPSQDKHCIFARGEEKLYLCDPVNNVILTLFERPVHSLSFIPHMYNEIIFLDSDRFIWHGEVGGNLIQLKCAVHDIESVLGSDHPRLVYASGKNSVHLIDLRVGSSSGEILYTVPEYDDSSRNSYYYQYESAFERQSIHKLCSLPDAPQVVLICLSKRFVLVDERMRGLVCLEMGHSIYHGGHYVTAAPPLQDIIGGGAIYPIYALQHTIFPDVQTFSLYRHSDSTMWSSLASIKRLQQPQSAAAFYRQHPKHQLRISRRAERQLFGGGPTRAITFVKSGSQKLYLFRMMDDGSLWNEEISIQDDKKRLKRALRKGAAKIKRMIDNNDQIHLRVDDMGSGLKQEGKVFNVKTDFDLLQNNFHGAINEIDPLDTRPELSCSDPELVISVHDDQLLSKIQSLFSWMLEQFFNQFFSVCCETFSYRITSIFDTTNFWQKGCSKQAYGFRGSLGFSVPADISKIENNADTSIEGAATVVANRSPYDSAHISQTYVSLCCLLILGDDLSRVDRKAVLEGVRCCQVDDGSFRGQEGTENDMRFVYCAIAICFMLNDFGTIDLKSVLKFIQRCVNFDGGIGQAPMLESHGGSTFCAVASLAMAGHLWDESVLTHQQIERLIKWALWKQNDGFHGRANKPDDSCYSFWIGGTLKILDVYVFVNEEKLRSFILSTQDMLIGGFSKFIDVVSDALHTCYSISALSLLREPDFLTLYTPLNITSRAAEHLIAHLLSGELSKNDFFKAAAVLFVNRRCYRSEPDYLLHQQDGHALIKHWVMRRAICLLIHIVSELGAGRFWFPETCPSKHPPQVEHLLVSYVVEIRAVSGCT
ncbi:unnamed protein product [Thelazia callipaeda]|uniref:Mab-21 domain-containing protein n=1 Tax=Thelazia callipaeda TaxID=103827 RepID=A0A158RBP0_THECL|nr:unnamed protein product [Thelazia callipaeda]